MNNLLGLVLDRGSAVKGQKTCLSSLRLRQDDQSQAN
jgi:hypothetical protein